MADTPTQFDYLLNQVEHAGQQEQPAMYGYAEKRAALFAYVRDLEARRSASTERQLLRCTTCGRSADSCHGWPGRRCPNPYVNSSCKGTLVKSGR